MPIYRLTMLPSAILLVLVLALFVLLFAERPAPVDANGNQTTSVNPVKSQERIPQ